MFKLGQYVKVAKLSPALIKQYGYADYSYRKIGVIGQVRGHVGERGITCFSVKEGRCSPDCMVAPILFVAQRTYDRVQIGAYHQWELTETLVTKQGIEKKKQAQKKLDDEIRPLIDWFND